MSQAERQLLTLIRERSFRLGTFRLASGDTSDYYIDGKMTEVCSLGAFMIGEVFYERTSELEFDAIGGLEAGAIPLATATVISYHHHGKAIEGFWVRDKAKAHGTKKLIEGKLKPGSRVIIVDDVITRGSSVIKAVEEVRKIDCQIVQVISLVDRLSGARQLFIDNGILDYRPVFTISDLGVATNVPRPADVTSG